MGIYLRYAAALIILATVSDSYAATRKNVSMPSKQSVIEGSGASFQTPNGEAAYYGRDFVDEHSAGNRFKPSDSPGTPKQKVALKPTLKVNPRTAAKAMAGAMRGGVPGVVASAAAAVIVAAVDGIIEDSQVKVPYLEEVPTNPDSEEYYWVVSEIHDQRFSSAYSALGAVVSFRNSTHPQFTHSLGQTRWQGDALLQYCVIQSSPVGNPNNNCWFDIHRYGSKCPAGSNYIASSGACSVTGFSTPSDSHWSSMEDFAAAQNSDFIRDIVKRSCEGSLSPSRCFDEMSDWGDLIGPSSQVGPVTTSVTTTKNADGTTSVTTTNTQNRYEYKYGDNHYNYSTTTKVTETTDGVTTEKETSDGGLPAPGEEPSETEEDENYSFSDTDMPPVPSFYEQQYPDGLSGVWDNASSQVNDSQFMQFLNGFIPSFSGSCPSFGLSFNIASWASYGSIGFSSLCYVFDFIKVILLVTALFTFRAITFGG